MPPDLDRPRALDLFCGAGGAAMGLWRAGFDVVGVDNRPQRHYPFPFILGDALQPPVRLSDFDLIWASPPCQGYSIMRNLPWLRGREYPMLIPPTRAMLQGGPLFIIENVNQARRTSALPEGIQGGYLCGTMFGLPIYRHRRFETSFHWFAPSHEKHVATIRAGHRDVAFTRPNGMRYGFDQENSAVGHGARKRSGARIALGVEWMNCDEATQAIPPAYSEHVGRYAMMSLGREPDAMARKEPAHA